MQPSKKHMRPACARKQRYDTLQAAQAAAFHLARSKAAKGNAIVTYLRAYGCTCGGFHFGKTRDINWELVKQLDAERRAA